MEKLKEQFASLPRISAAGEQYLSYQAATDTVAAFLFPTRPTEQMGASDYQRILETADTLCRELAYQQVVKLTPPDVDFADMGLYWSTIPQSDAEAESILIHAGPRRISIAGAILLGC